MLNILVLESEVKLLNLINTGRKTITSLNEKENEDPHTYFNNLGFGNSNLEFIQNF